MIRNCYKRFYTEYVDFHKEIESIQRINSFYSSIAALYRSNEDAICEQKITTIQMNATANRAIAATAIQQRSGFELFRAFSQIALSGFGGVLPFAYRGLVEKRNWLTAAEFAEFLGLSQILPGPTICNVALMVGHRFGGIWGALCALAGMIFFPFLSVIALGICYEHFGELTLVQNALKGMGAVAAGLILGTAAKMALKMFHETIQRRIRASQTALVSLAFAGLVVLEWKLIYVFGLLAIGGTSLFYVIGSKHGQ